MRCNELSDRLSPYLDGALPPADAESVGASRPTCSECRVAGSTSCVRSTASCGRILSSRCRGLRCAASDADRFLASAQAGDPSARGAGMARAPVCRRTSCRRGDRPACRSRGDADRLRRGLHALVRATGPVEVISSSGVRTSLIPERPIVLTDGARVRTSADALCEARNRLPRNRPDGRADGAGRASPGAVELVEGQMWAQAAKQCELGIHPPPPPPPPPPLGRVRGSPQVVGVPVPHFVRTAVVGEDGCRLLHGSHGSRPGPGNDVGGDPDPAEVVRRDRRWKAGRAEPPDGPAGGDPTAAPAARDEDAAGQRAQARLDAVLATIGERSWATFMRRTCSSSGRPGRSRSSPISGRTAPG